MLAHMTRILILAFVLVSLVLGGAPMSRADDGPTSTCDRPAPKGYWYSGALDASGHYHEDCGGLLRHVPSAVGLTDEEEVKCSVFTAMLVQQYAQSRYDDCIWETVAAKRREAETAAKDDNICKSYGLKFGTGDYAQCRQNLSNQRAADGRALIQSHPSPPPVEVHPTPPPTQSIPLPPEPVTTDCRMIGNMLRCKSQ